MIRNVINVLDLKEVWKYGKLLESQLNLMPELGSDNKMLNSKQHSASVY